MGSSNLTIKEILKTVLFKARFFVLGNQARILSIFGKNESIVNKKSTILFKGVMRFSPKTIELNIHKNFLSQLELKQKESTIFSVTNAFVSLKEGFIFQNSGKLFNENYLFLPITSYPSLLTKFVFSSPKEINSKVCIIPGTRNYFHWMFETLPRIMVLKRSGALPKIILAEQSTSFQKESLKAALPKTIELLPLSESNSYLVDELIVPTMPQYSGNPSKEVCLYLRELFLSNNSKLKPNKKYEKIYICRGNAKNKRSVVNEKEVIEYLQSKGFTRVVMDGLSIEEQAKIFSSAKVIVAPHGGALTNLVFCNKGTKLVEIFHPNYVNACFWAISNCVGLDYSYFFGSKKSSLEKDLDILIDLDKLSKALSLLKIN